MPRAAVFHGPDRPLELVSFAAPSPTGAEILARVSCCTLCRSDLHTFAGRRTEPTPTVLGHEIVGRIADFGPSAPRFDARGDMAAVGDRVTWSVVVGCGSCFFCLDELPQKCERLRKFGHERIALDRPVSGGLSEYVMLVPGTAWFRVPDAIADEVVAMANCATATVAAVLRAAGPLTGRTVLVLGAGVLGVTACAMLRANGARSVIAADPLAENRERARTFGADAVASTPAEVAACVAAETDGRGADCVLELSGAREAVALALEQTRIGGTIVLAGSVAPSAAVAIEPEKLVRRLVTLRGVHNYHPRDLETALAFLAGPGREYPFASLIAASYGLDAVGDAFAHAERAPGRRVTVRVSDQQSS